MTSGLRKAHKYIWLALTIVIPTVMAFAIKDLQFPAKNTQTKTGIPRNSAVVKGVENDVAWLILTKYQTISVNLKSPLKYPSSLVYELNKDGSQGRFLGQLTNSMIVHHFEIEKPISGIIIYDALKESEITKLTF